MFESVPYIQGLFSCLNQYPIIQGHIEDLFVTLLCILFLMEALKLILNASL